MEQAIKEDIKDNNVIKWYRKLLTLTMLQKKKQKNIIQLTTNSWLSTQKINN